MVAMKHVIFFLKLSVIFFALSTTAQMPGFVSFDCGGKENFTDELGLNWTPDERFIYGETSTISVANETRKQYTTLRHFPADTRKYCYTFPVISRRRYLIRASFLYGNFDNINVYPSFEISLGATHWSTIVISDASTIEVQELIFLALDPTISICLSNATTGQPFISTLELRQFNGSVYYTEYENLFYLSISARINFGADSEAAVRYPDDPFDRIWESDSIKRANYLVDVAAGTEKVSTKMPIDVHRDELPPERVMQTAVVGTNGSLTYRLNLDGFPACAWAFTYFAEIEDFNASEVRKFRLVLPGLPDVSKAVVNIQENAHGRYRLYEPGYPNISLPFVLSFRFRKTSDSSRGPLINAMEINKYLRKADGSLDGPAMADFVSRYSSEDWAQEGGDPCLPVPWSWVICSADQQRRIISVKLSRKNLTGNIPIELIKMSGLVELWLDGNSLIGPIPDFTECINLIILHLENNQLMGNLPPSLGDLSFLKELYVQNNMLSGVVPLTLLNRHLILNFSGNVHLHKRTGQSRLNKIIIVSSTVAFLLLAAAMLYHRQIQGRIYSQREQRGSQRLSFRSGDAATDAAHYFTLNELEDATRNFQEKIGFGGFGVVYHGVLKDGREIAVKVLTNNSFQGKREFTNEVVLLSRIHHRNLVQFLGYCQDGKNILVYEFMHKGTLKEHLYCDDVQDHECLSWVKRLEIAEDAAKGINYLHTGCVPTVIHRDLKSSNILLDKQMRAKVSDFGLSKLAVDGCSHVSSIVRGTVGYLDPEYYISQQLTEKSDVYSFGVILLELITGREPIFNNDTLNCRNIVQWTTMRIESGDIEGIVDPRLGKEYDVQSMWKIAEKALMCVKGHGSMRPAMSEIIKDIQDAISIETTTETAVVGEDPQHHHHISTASIHSSLNMDDEYSTQRPMPR